MEIIKFKKISNRKYIFPKVKVKCNNCETKLLINSIHDVETMGITYEGDSHTNALFTKCPYCGECVHLDYKKSKKLCYWARINFRKIPEYVLTWEDVK